MVLRGENEKLATTLPVTDDVKQLSSLRVADLDDQAGVLHITSSDAGLDAVDHASALDKRKILAHKFRPRKPMNSPVSTENGAPSPLGSLTSMTSP
jgi:hypothetical protein